MSKSKIDRLLPVLSTASVIGLWYFFRAIMPPERRFMLPPPHEILQAYVDKAGALWSAAVNTSIGALLGFSFAVALSLIMSLILSLSARIRSSLYPHLMVLQMTPIIVLTPILILWVGPGIKSIVIITFLICFFPLVVNTTQGLISTETNLVDFFKMCGATRRQEILWLRMPAAMPYFFTGLRIAATLAPIGAIIGDVYAGNASGGQGGLGFLTFVYSAQFEMAALFAAASVCCVLGFMFVGVVLFLSWWAMHKWHDNYQTNR